MVEVYSGYIFKKNPSNTLLAVMANKQNHYKHNCPFPLELPLIVHSLVHENPDGISGSFAIVSEGREMPQVLLPARPFKSGGTASTPIIPPSRELEEAGKCCLKESQGFRTAVERCKRLCNAQVVGGQHSVGGAVCRPGLRTAMGPGIQLDGISEKLCMFFAFCIVFP